MGLDGAPNEAPIEALGRGRQAGDPPTFYQPITGRWHGEAGGGVSCVKPPRRGGGPESGPPGRVLLNEDAEQDPTQGPDPCFKGPLEKGARDIRRVTRRAAPFASGGRSCDPTPSASGSRWRFGRLRSRV